MLALPLLSLSLSLSPPLLFPLSTGYNCLFVLIQIPSLVLVSFPFPFPLLLAFVAFVIVSAVLRFSLCFAYAHFVYPVSTSQVSLELQSKGYTHTWQNTHTHATEMPKNTGENDKQFKKRICRKEEK